jgi:hypothetical protein
MEVILNQLEQLIIPIDIKTRSLDKIWFSSYMLGCKLNIIVGSALLLQQFDSDIGLKEKLESIAGLIALYSEGVLIDADLLVQDIEDCLVHLRF